MHRLTSKALTATLILCSLLLIAPARPADDQFPEGPGKATFIKVCSQCHALDPIATLRYSKDQWKDLVDDMKGKGAEATGEECNVIVEYLFKNFGKKEEDKK
jgi:mono/diheme cytochrome c family protein